mgnify:FL=1
MNIYNFIKSLNSDEKSLISKHLSCSSKSVSDDGGILKLLWNYIINNLSVTLTDEVVSKAIGSTSNNRSFEKSKSRLFIRILDVFTSEAFINKETLLDESSRSLIAIRKKLLQVRILRFKTNKISSEVELHLLNEIIEKSKELEQYEATVEALVMKKYLVGNRLGYSAFLEVQQEINFYSECNRSLRLANDFYYIFNTNKGLISRYSENELTNQLNEEIKRLENDPFLTISSSIQHYYKIF